MKRRIEITVETQRVTLVGRRSVAVNAWCELCGARSIHATPEEAARHARTTPRAVYRCLEAGSIHFTEDAAGEPPLVCLKSLSDLFGGAARKEADAAPEGAREKLYGREDA
ncbi:MAG TPA: hypothetical protein VIQ24_12480 [Pyrinomonadaceae bacterium]